MTIATDQSLQHIAAELQRNLLISHLSGAGQEASREVVRATMLIRANCLARGHSGIRPEVVDLLLDFLQRDIVPIVPEVGSLGASGDLIPLSYIAATLIGETEVRYRGVRCPISDVLSEENLRPVQLEAKEGLALINGTAFAAGFAVLALEDAERLADVADLATAMACQALLENADNYDDFLDAVKLHTGPWARSWLTTAINSSTDNPLFDVAAGKARHGGNFYAGHIGQAMDALKVAAANVADVLDRQLELVIDEKFNRGLPPNLAAPMAAAPDGLHQGLKSAQIVCSALAAEALQGAAPMTTFSRSTEAHNQDKVSMGTEPSRVSCTPQFV